MNCSRMASLSGCLGRRLTGRTLAGRRYLSRPADPDVQRMIRVDHAGELGADRIYAGQLAVLGNTQSGPVIREMWDQEKVHLKLFEELVQKNRVRPTALTPLWSVAGFALGAGTALMGKEAAMACTVAVEEVISDHYNAQLRRLLSKDGKDTEELMKVIQRCRNDELEHLDTGLEHGAKQAPFYTALSEVIKAGCRGAIFMAERV